MESMDIYGIHEYPWIFIHVHGHPWIYIDIYGIHGYRVLPNARGRNRSRHTVLLAQGGQGSAPIPK